MSLIHEGRAIRYSVLSAAGDMVIDTFEPTADGDQYGPATELDFAQIERTLLQRRWRHGGPRGSTARATISPPTFDGDLSVARNARRSTTRPPDRDDSRRWSRNGTRPPP